MHWYQQAADQGYADAQFCLGFAYKYGEGVEPSDEEAVHWYRQAADQGVADAAQSCLKVEAAIAADAQFCLGVAYEDGKGAEQSNEGAVHWYRQAADQGHAAAQFCLGFAYENGRGVEQSNKGAVLWYRQAANQGDADAAPFCLEVEAAIAAAEAKAAENK